MSRPTLTYRIWQCGIQWHWQLMSEDRKEVLRSGTANASSAARSAAFTYCLEHPSDPAQAK